MTTQKTNGAVYETAPEVAVSQPSQVTIQSPQGSRYEPEAPPDVYRAIACVAKAISREGVGKDGRNQQQGYAFRGIDQIMNALSGLLADAELVILPRMRSRTQEERTTAKGGVLFYVVVHADFAFVSARDGSRHTVTMYGEAMDSGDKATNKAMSAAFKYAMLQAFCIPLEGTPDADQTTHEPAPKPERHAPNAAQREVAEAKIATMRKPPQPAVAIAEQIPEPHEPEGEIYYEDAPDDEQPTLEEQLHESIAAVQRLNTNHPPKRGPGYYDMLKAFGEMKKRYRAIGFERTYYAMLGLYGQRHSNEFPDTAEGLSGARACYKEMSLDVANREVKGR